MNLNWIDWSIVIVFIVFLTGLAVYAKQFNKGVADFLAANRCAGRYLLTITRQIAAIGAISFVARFEEYYRSGFCGLWWLYVIIPVYMAINMSGFVQYRYRETRVLTLGQFFEIRYSKKFRIFSGILMWLSGILNMGIFPAVGARFFIYFCGFPETFTLFGIEGISTFVTIMLLELSIALLFTFLGGMIVVIITDFFQGVFCSIVFVVILVFLLLKFDWSQITATLRMVPEGSSMFNPYDTSKVEGFSMGFYLMQIFGIVYGVMAWQGTGGYNVAAKSAHEAKMGNVISVWRLMAQTVLLAFLPICVFVYLNNSDFATQAQQVQTAVSSINNDTLQDQMMVPIAISHMLPFGLLGLVLAVFIAAAISSDDTYLHSWGSIFVQDVILPFRKKSFTPKQHVWILRASILFVAVFIFFFSLLYKQNDFILMFLFMTGAIYLGGAGSVIIGGLYWKRGTTAAAWSAMITGAVFILASLLLRNYWADLAPLLEKLLGNSQFLTDHKEEFPLNGMQLGFTASILSIIVYVSVSLWQWLVLRYPAFNMNRMLHRGKYAIKGEHAEQVTLPPTGLRAFLPSKEFTGTDKILFWASVSWSAFWAVLTIGVTIFHMVFGTSDQWWESLWFYYLWFMVIVGLATTVWFLIGGLCDLKEMLSILRTAVRNIDDDGRVVGHHSVVDEELEKDKPGVIAELETDTDES